MSAHIVIAGGSGLIGTALSRALSERGDRTTALVRHPARRPGEAEWDPIRGVLDTGHLEGADVVVVLNGASVGRMPWTKRYREELVSSRIAPVRTVATALEQMGGAAPALVSGSAVGYYGSAPGAVLTEASAAGDTFLARLCVDWEAAARAAESVTRVALLRTAPVIHRHGVLRPMVLLTSLGLGGPLGRGTQIWPWISLEDEIRAILHIIDTDISGPVNLSGPEPATASDTGCSLARALHRPFWLPAPEWGLNLALGRAAVQSLLTADADVRPERLTRQGFVFTHATVDSAIRAAIGATGRG